MTSQERPEPESNTEMQPPSTSAGEPPSTSTTPTDEPPKLPAHLDPTTYPRTLTIPPKNIYLELTYDPLNPSNTLNQITSPKAGANILFIGTTRDNFENRPVKLLSYTSYAPLALKTLKKVAEDAVEKFGLEGISISHRLGVVPVCEASIVVGVSCGHRGPAWRAGEEVLEIVKEKLEVWKREVFEDETDGEQEGGVWRANRDRDAHGRLISSTTTTTTSGGGNAGDNNTTG